MLAILLYNGQDIRGNNTVRLAKVVVDFLGKESADLKWTGQFLFDAVYLPWRVKVIDCSNFSNSSVRVRFRAEGPGRAMVLACSAVVELEGRNVRAQFVLFKCTVSFVQRREVNQQTRAGGTRDAGHCQGVRGRGITLAGQATTPLSRPYSASARLSSQICAIRIQCSGPSFGSVLKGDSVDTVNKIMSFKHSG